MTLDLPGIRPAIIPRNIEEKLDELRRFRHLFRNLYKSSIKPNRVLELKSEIGPLMDTFAASHADFMQWLEQLIQEEHRNLHDGEAD